MDSIRSDIPAPGNIPVGVQAPIVAENPAVGDKKTSRTAAEDNKKCCVKKSEYGIVF
jgi:hypothetical protein